MSMRKLDDAFNDFLIIGTAIFMMFLLMRACDVAEEAVKSFRYEQPSKSAPP